MSIPPDALLIRAAVASDVPDLHDAICAIGRHVGQEHKVTSSADDLSRHMFGPDPAIEGLVAVHDDRFAGASLFFRSYSTWMGGTGVYVQDLYVGEAFRGLGVGERLMRETARLARSRGAVYLWLAVDLGNRAAMRFYDRVGMEADRTDEMRYAAGPAFDALCE